MAEYYDMQEVTGKLRKTEEEIQELVKQGRLRQYLDSGKAVFKVEDVDALAEEIVGLDISSVGLESGGSDLDIELDASSDMLLEPDEQESPKAGGPDDMELDLEPDMPGQEKSEGGFGLSQMGDLTMADTNVGTVGINILSGTGDAYKLTEDTKAETQAADIDDIDSLDADSNLESFGSGSGLLDLSLQADDTSLGAVLDDILPTGAEGGGANLPVDEGIGIMDESEDLLSGREPAGPGGEDVTAPMGAAAMMPGSPQMVAVVPVDSKTTFFGVLMFMPMLALILAAIVLTAAIQDVMPSLIQPLIKMQIAETVSLIWVIVGGLVVLLLLVLMFSALSGGGGGTKAKKEKAPKKEKRAKKKRK
ncbi:MAG: hypothetical protein ACYS72_01395 [Planctomycetota bacterium]|jgi:hypothetical protein